MAAMEIFRRAGTAVNELFSRRLEPCAHVPLEHAAPRADRCEECGSGHNLRACSTCGHVGCCDSQAGHARSHFHDSGHPVMRSMPVGRGFTWCYVDDAYTAEASAGSVPDAGEGS